MCCNTLQKTHTAKILTMKIFPLTIAALGWSAVLEIWRRKGLLEQIESEDATNQEAITKVFPLARTSPQAWVWLWLSFLLSCSATLVGIILSLHLQGSAEAIATTTEILHRSFTMNEVIGLLSLGGGLVALGSLGFRYRTQIARGYRKAINARDWLLIKMGFTKIQKSSKSYEAIDLYIEQLDDVQGLSRKVGVLNNDNVASASTLVDNLDKLPGESARTRIRRMEGVYNELRAAHESLLAQIDDVIGGYYGRMSSDNYRFVNNAGKSAPKTAQGRDVKATTAEAKANEPTVMAWFDAYDQLANWNKGTGNIQISRDSQLYSPNADYIAVRHNQLSRNAAINSLITWPEAGLQSFSDGHFLLIKGEALQALVTTLGLVSGRDIAVLPARINQNDSEYALNLSVKNPCTLYDLTSRGIVSTGERQPLNLPKWTGNN